MVLQKAAHVPIWGTGAPGEDVTVSIAGQTAQAKAARSGKWKAILNLAQSGPGPYQMTVKGTNMLQVNDVLVGEVWLASGQSNMELTLEVTTGAAQEIAASANPQLRQFIVVKKTSAVPLDDLQGAWFVASPATTLRFSAVAYYFSKDLQQNLKVPVGVINSSFGGSTCEAWMSGDAISRNPDVRAAQDKAIADLASYPARLKKFAAGYPAWAKQFYYPWAAKYAREDHEVGDPQQFAAPTANTSDWKTIRLPGQFAQAGLPYNGAVWIRRQVPVSVNVAGRPLRVDIGTIRDFTTVYWSGVKIGGASPETPPGRESKWTCMVPRELVKAGTATLAVRVFSPRGDASLNADALGYNFRTVQHGNVTFLAGDWLAKAEYSLPPLDPTAVQAFPREPAPPAPVSNIPGTLFNAMLNPLIPYAIRGIIWYQGESNASFAYQYRTLFPAMIEDWWTHWQRPDLPFYFCQLPVFGDKVPVPSESNWAELREAQSFALALPATAEAVLIDQGDENELHPRNKKPAGDRLAAIALAEAYGRDVPHQGPVFQKMTKEGAAIRICFGHGSGDLVAHPLPARYQRRSTSPDTVPLVRNSPQSQLEGFAICGANHQWKWADAKIDGNTVVVSSSAVPDPIAVRYAWASTPTCNLFNAAGFPAAPFRTDDFPISTAKRP
jgi:sialate O-acetylesterase